MCSEFGVWRMAYVEAGGWELEKKKKRKETKGKKREKQSLSRDRFLRVSRRFSVYGVPGTVNPRETMVDSIVDRLFRVPNTSLN